MKMSQHKIDKRNIFRHIAEQKKFREQRKIKLWSELRRMGVEPRDDSRLCRKYIFGENIPVESIALMLIETDWYHKNTAYNEVNHIMQACHKQHCPIDIDPFVVKDMFSCLAKQDCYSLQPKTCSTERCLLNYHA